MSFDFFRLYGGIISDPGMLLSTPKIIERLFTPIVNERNLAGLKWVRISWRMTVTS